jgi:ATP-binding protein involved in chromosome partitioning
MSDQQQLQGALRDYIDPYLEQDLVSAGVIHDLAFHDGRVSLRVELGFPAAGHTEQLREQITRCLTALDDVTNVEIDIGWRIQSHAVQSNLQPLKNIRNVIAVASGKGGVGKSTTAVNLALALIAEGARVGLLDADIYGPSQPRMLGLQGQQPESPDGKTMLPMRAYGLQCMSAGFLVDEEQPMVWRGPMATSALNQLITETRWEDLDYLIVDMPPGTGDIQLTLSQRVPVSGAVIVTTPQDIALLDARKGLKMFQKVGVSILGIVENMSTHICSNCGHEEPVFGSGGGESIAAQYAVPLLGSLPLDLRIREQADGGKPTVIAEPDSPITSAYRDIARRTAARLAISSRDYSHAFPKITIEGA